LWLKNPSDPWDRVINSDGKGYYAYLPALFIYHDLSFSFIDGYENNYYPKGGDLYKDFRVDTGSGIADKYFPGLAILWLPFFLIAHFIALVFGFSADGYSAPYQLLIALSALFYLCCGLLLLRKFLTKYTNNETIAAWVTLLTGLATNLIYYTLVEGSMVHVYNFFLVNAFILLVLEVRERPRLLNFTMISVVLALIIIIRPQNGLLIFSVPFLAGSRERFSELIKAFFRKPAMWSISLSEALIILLIPLIIWQLQTGSIFVYTYGSEHFNLLQPHLFKFLLGFEKGWLIYTPVAAISLLGFIPLFRDSRYAFFTLAGFLLLLVYVLSSWWAWNYTSQHSQRVMIDFLAFVAILLVVLFRNVRHGRAFHLINLLFVILILINFLQLYQQKVWVYPKGRVTARAYFKNFFSLKPNGTFYIPENAIEGKLTFRTDFEAVAPLFGAHNVKETSQAFSGTHVLVVDTARNVPVFARALSAMRSSEPILLRIGSRFLETDKASKLRVIVKYGQSADYYGANEYVLSESLRFGKWDYSEYVSYVPYIQSVNDSVFIELQSEQGTVLADDFIVEFITLKPGEQFDWFGKPPEIIESSVLTKCDMDNSAPKGWRNTDKAVAGDSYSGEKSCLI
ncbi:MAG TPA: hypothetical protein PLP88_12720, partial [Bacteroidales bacterium]|nr:hypothetical protein [Bacteroidales bacterium]